MKTSSETATEISRRGAWLLWCFRHPLPSPYKLYIGSLALGMEDYYVTRMIGSVNHHRVKIGRQSLHQGWHRQRQIPWAVPFRTHFIDIRNDNSFFIWSLVETLLQFPVNWEPRRYFVPPESSAGTFYCYKLTSCPCPCFTPVERMSSRTLLRSHAKGSQEVDTEELMETNLFGALRWGFSKFIFNAKRWAFSWILTGLISSHLALADLLFILTSPQKLLLR